MEKVRIPPYRYDYFLIWGHGLKYKNDILNIIRSQSDLEILKIVAHRPTAIKHLVKAIYSYDYAPYFHLRSKTRYLMKTPGEVLFIFVKNNNPDEDYSGEGEFRHIESGTLKPIKESIRDRFNDRVKGKRTEDHVIHASDNESQTHHILKYLNMGGLECLSYQTPTLNLPSYIRKYKSFSIKQAEANSLKCRILVGDRFNYKTEILSVAKSPHFLGLKKNHDIYRKYIDRFSGGPLKQDYSLHRYLTLANNFKYLKNGKTTDYITVEPSVKNHYIILDGLHRASILLNQDMKQFPVAILH